MTDPSIADSPSPYSPSPRWPAPVATPAPPATPAKAAASVAARTRMLLEGPILPTLLRLAAPNVLNLLAFAGVITFDGFFLGRIGTNALVFHAFLLALAVAAIYSTVLLLGAPFLFRSMGGRGEMLADALSYANVALGGAIAICVSNLLGNAVRGTGNMSFPASVLVGCVLAHIVIAPLLMFGLGPLPALGPAGAGWGLVIPFAGGSVVMIWYLRSSNSIIRLSFFGPLPRWALFADILKVG